MRRLSNLPLAWVLLVLAVHVRTAAAQQGSQESLVEYRAPSFSLGIPGTWAVVADPIVAFSAAGPGAVTWSRPTVKVVAAALRPGMTLNRYVANSKSAYASLWTVREEATSRLDSAAAIRLVLDQSLGPMITRVLKYYLVRSGRIYVVSLSCGREDFARHLPLFERVAHSFRIVAQSRSDRPCQPPHGAGRRDCAAAGLAFVR